MEFPYHGELAGILVGLVLGAALTELRTAFQRMRDSRRALRVLLFQLLQLRFRVRRRNPEQVVQMIKKTIAIKYGAEAGAAIEMPEARDVLLKMIRTAQVELSEHSLNSDFDEAIRSIAPDDPILAYLLAGQEQILRLDQLAAAYFDKVIVMPEIGVPTDGRDAVKKIEANLLGLAYDDACDDLATDIKRIAGKISIWTWYQASRAIARQDKSMDAVPMEEYDRVFEGVVTGVRGTVPSTDE